MRVALGSSEPKKTKCWTSLSPNSMWNRHESAASIGFRWAFLKCDCFSFGLMLICFLDSWWTIVRCFSYWKVIQKTSRVRFKFSDLFFTLDSVVQIYQRVEISFQRKIHCTYGSDRITVRRMMVLSWRGIASIQVFAPFLFVHLFVNS